MLTYGPVTFGVTHTGPKPTLQNQGNEGSNFSGFYSFWDGHYDGGTQHQYFQTDPNVPDGSGSILEFSGIFWAAHYPWGPDGQLDYTVWPRDTGAVTTPTRYGDAKGHVEITGSANSDPRMMPPIMVGPTNVATGEALTWRAMTRVDTNSFRFRWLVDGSVIENDNALYTTAMALPGNHTMAALATMADGHVDTITTSIYSNFVAYINGPGAIEPNVAATWTANIPGGYPPYTYQWKLDDVSVGSGQSYARAFGPSESHTLELFVTDSHSFSASNALVIYSTAGGTCFEPPCP